MTAVRRPPGKGTFMIRRSFLQCVAIAVLAMALAAGPAMAAAGRLGLHPSSEARSWLAPVWDFLSSLLSGGETVQPGEGLDNRCTIDPDGRTVCVETDPPNG